MLSTGVASHTKPGHLIELKYVPILKTYRAFHKNDSFLIVHCDLNIYLVVPLRKFERKLVPKDNFNFNVGLFLVMEYIINITDWNVNLYWHNVLITGNWTHSQVCSIMLVKTKQYKSSGISSANLLRALEIFDLPPAVSPELNKCPGSNPVYLVFFNLLHNWAVARFASFLFTQILITG